ncbi:MAG: hypothetical protein U1F67_25405, partial [Rubrivivax sp.]
AWEAIASGSSQHGDIEMNSLSRFVAAASLARASGLLSLPVLAQQPRRLADELAEAFALGHRTYSCPTTTPCTGAGLAGSSPGPVLMTLPQTADRCWTA